MKSLLAPVVACAALLAIPPGSGAVTIASDDGRARVYQHWADRAVAPLPAMTIQVTRSHPLRIPGASPARSHTAPGLPIYFAPGDGRAVFLHELGHQAEYAMSDPARDAFLLLTHQSGRAWREPPDSPHEQMAEAWSLCAGGIPHGRRHHRHVWGAYGYEPTIATHRAEGARLGWPPAGA